MKRAQRSRLIKWTQHLVFWVLSVYAVGTYFSISTFLKFIDFFYSALFHIPLVFLVYVNLNLLIPGLLERRKYVVYGLSVLTLLFATYGLHELTFELLLPLLPIEYYMVSFTDWVVLVRIFSIYLILTTLLRLSKSWYTLQRVEREKLQMELTSLKMQVNPHFLFNSLNSIYSLSLKKDQRTPEVVLELSNLMRYMLYEVGDDKVLLEKEIEAMRAYIHLQKLRADASASIDFQVEGNISERKVAPLLFIPLIENSFKHGVKGTSDQGYVSIHLEVEGNELDFSIKNNKGEVDDVEEGKFGGIGLQNVRKRLELIYPERHIIDVIDSEDCFEVKIQLVT